MILDDRYMNQHKSNIMHYVMHYIIISALRYALYK